MAPPSDSSEFIVAIHKDGSGYSFTDLADRYRDLSVKGALRGREPLRAKADDAIPA